MPIPTHIECLTLLDTYRTPLHVVQHSLMVNKVAVFLAKKLEGAGDDIDIDLVDSASLLHDFLRVVDFEDFDPEQFTQTITKEDHAAWLDQQQKYRNLHHAVAGKHELEQLGFDEVAEVVGAHGAQSIRNGTLDTLEKQVVYYADKRVSHTTIVTIEERFAEWGDRHQWSDEKRAEVAEEMEKVLELEKELFASLKIRPSALMDLAAKE